MLKIGITGGIGSGKSTASSFFKELGIPVFSADDYAKEILHSLANVKKDVINLFGDDVYTENGELNRSKLASLVFKDKDKLEQLNAIVHPQVALGFEKWVDQQTNVPYVLKEAAILFESKSYQQLDKIIVITSPLEDRISRVMQRDGVSKDLVLDRVKHQWTDEQRIAKADYILTNDTLESLKMQVYQLHQQLKS